MAQILFTTYVVPGALPRMSAMTGYINTACELRTDSDNRMPCGSIKVPQVMPTTAPPFKAYPHVDH